MITIITTTNRPNNSTVIFGKAYQHLLNELDLENQLLSMEDLPSDLRFTDMFAEKPTEFTELHNKFLNGVDKLIVVSPEYNGSFPGVFKAFIDITAPTLFNGKKVMLTGVASGRAGNLRGMDHLTDVFNHVKAEVHWNKLPISGIDSLIKEGKVTDEETLELMNQQLSGFLKF